MESVINDPATAVQLPQGTVVAGKNRVIEYARSEGGFRLKMPNGGLSPRLFPPEKMFYPLFVITDTKKRK